MVIEPHPLGDQPPRREAVGDLVQIDELVFQRLPKPLDEHIVQPSATPVHTDLDPVHL